MSHVRLAAGSAAGIVLAVLLTGCSGVPVGSLPGTPASTGGTPGPSTAPKGASCTPHGSAIPDGHYGGAIKATIKTTLTITADGISMPNAGSGTEAWKGTIDLVSRDGKVTGTLTMSELGLSQVGQPGSAQVHSVDNGDLKGALAGTSDKPTVAATGTGDWASLDAPVINGSGSADSSFTGGLHVTRADCTSISGDAVAMFADFMAPVAQYLAVSGDGTWVATRK